MINIIFDIDETLVSSLYFDNSITGPDSIKFLETGYRNTEIFHIKHLYDFSSICICRNYSALLLRYCFENFNVGFWTAGKNRIIPILKKILMPEEYKKCICIISRTNNNDNTWKCIDYVNNHTFTVNKLAGNMSKHLSILFNDNKNYKNINETNTILIDNSEWNIVPNPKNSIYVIDCCHTGDNVLFLLYQYFTKMKKDKIKNVLNIDFNEFFKKINIMKSCYNNKFIKIQKEYEIGDIVNIKDNKYYGAIVDKHVSDKKTSKHIKTSKHKTKSKSKTNSNSNSNITYTIVDAYYNNKDIFKNKFSNDMIISKIII